MFWDTFFCSGCLTTQSSNRIGSEGKKKTDKTIRQSREEDKTGQSASTNFHIFSSNRDKSKLKCSTFKTNKYNNSSAQQVSIPVDCLTRILVNEANISVLYRKEMDPYMGNEKKYRHI